MKCVKGAGGADEWRGASHVTYHTIARYSTNKRYIVKISLQLQPTATTVTNIFYIHLEAACGFMTFQ